MSGRDELARIVDEVRDDPARRDMSRIIEREYSQARWEGFGEWDQARLVAHHLHTAGYRQIFDGDCGLSNIKDPDEREAAEAWMRWGNLAMNDEIGAIGAMKQMLTELGYRKAQPSTRAMASEWRAALPAVSPPSDMEG